MLKRAAVCLANQLNSRIQLDKLTVSMDLFIRCRFAWYFDLNAAIDGIDIDVFCCTYSEPLTIFVILCDIWGKFVIQFVCDCCNFTEVFWQCATLCGFIDYRFSILNIQRRPRWSSGYHTHLWIRRSRVRHGQGRWIFSEPKNFLWKGSKAVGPMS